MARKIILPELKILAFKMRERGCSYGEIFLAMREEHPTFSSARLKDWFGEEARIPSYIENAKPKKAKSKETSEELRAKIKLFYREDCSAQAIIEYLCDYEEITRTRAIKAYNGISDKKRGPYCEDGSITRIEPDDNLGYKYSIPDAGEEVNELFGQLQESYDVAIESLKAGNINNIEADLEGALKGVKPDSSNTKAIRRMIRKMIALKTGVQRGFEEKELSKYETCKKTIECLIGIEEYEQAYVFLEDIMEEYDTIDIIGPIYSGEVRSINVMKAIWKFCNQEKLNQTLIKHRERKVAKQGKQEKDRNGEQKAEKIEEWSLIRLIETAESHVDSRDYMSAIRILRAGRKKLSEPRDVGESTNFVQMLDILELRLWEDIVKNMPLPALVEYVNVDMPVIKNAALKEIQDNIFKNDLVKSAMALEVLPVDRQEAVARDFVRAQQYMAGGSIKGVKSIYKRLSTLKLEGDDLIFFSGIERLVMAGEALELGKEPSAIKVK